MNDHQETLGREIVRYLRENPNDSQGFPLELFAGQGWADYLTEMNKDGTYGDHITLQAASDIFSVQITVHSSLGVEANNYFSIYGGWSCQFQPGTLCRRAKGAVFVPRGRRECC